MHFLKLPPLQTAIVIGNIFYLLLGLAAHAEKNSQPIAVSAQVISSCHILTRHEAELKSPTRMHCNTAMGKAIVVAQRELIEEAAIRVAALENSLLIPAQQKPYLIDTINF